LLASLEREQQLLTDRNWTWRFKLAALEAIRPLNAYIDPDARPNLEHFQQLHSDFERARTIHDEKTSLLTHECRALHKALTTSDDFVGLFRRVTTLEALAGLGKELRDIFGAYPESDHLALIAEYVINNTEELPYYHTTAPFWNRHRERFLAFLATPRVKPQWHAAVRTGEDVLRLAQELTELLKLKRFDLSLRHDVPYVARAGASND